MKTTTASRPLPPPVPMGLRREWMLLNRSKAFVGEMRERHDDLVVFRVNRKFFVLLLSSRAVRQVLSTDPARFDAFMKESFIGLTGPRSLWALGGEPHRRERDLIA